MLADLAEAIDNLEIPLGGDALAEAIALRDRLEAKIAAATCTFEAGGLRGLDYSTSMVAWLRAHAGMTKRSAQRFRTLGVRLRALPVCAAAYASGEL